MIDFFENRPGVSERPAVVKVSPPNKDGYFKMAYEGSDEWVAFRGNGTEKEPLKSGAAEPIDRSAPLIYDLAHQREQIQYAEHNRVVYKVNPLEEPTVEIVHFNEKDWTDNYKKEDFMKMLNKAIYGNDAQKKP